jgi:hypothetical protein
MITNKGKEIIAKYLIGQAPAYASYIALGCGAKPLDTSEEFVDYSENTELNFEMFRVPIVSRGYVNEAGTPKIVFTAELPTEERYQISEIGLYSAAANPSATGNDSRTIFTFSNRENWEQHGTSSSTAIKRYDSNISKGAPNSGDMSDDVAEEDVFQTIANNPIFTYEERANRNEQSRFLNNIIAIRGDESNLTISTIDGKERLEYAENSESKHIHLNAIGINLEKNSPSDLMKIAFSVINKDMDAPVPDEVRIMVEFTPSDSSLEYARFDAIVTNNTDYDNEPGDESFVYPPEVDFTDNRYYVVSRELQELHKSTNFSWNEVNTVKIYVTVIKGTSLVSNKSATATAVTLTTSTNHSFVVGNKIIVSGLGNSGRFDGTFEITEVTSNTIKYNKAGAVISSTAVSPTVKIESPSEDYFVCLDALRLDNVATENPIYGLTGYSPVMSPDATPILKDINTKNFVEFRFAMGIESGIITS